MSKLHNLFLAAIMGSASLGALAQTDAEHTLHHPGGAASAPVANQPSSAKPAMSAEKMASMDKHMKAMQEMHQKMMSAKTPEERQALMAQHTKLMQEGMSMMPMMGAASQGMPGTMAKPQQMMEKRMEMMQSMMKMMMDQMPAEPAK